MQKSTVKYPFLTEDVEIYERENGHKIVLAHKEGELVNVSTWVKTGSINEDDKINGISHFLEHLMFKGTHKHKAGYFDKTLEAKGAIVNAATWKDYTFYYVTLPKGAEGKDLDLAIELHADMMLDPVLPEEEIGSPFDLNNPKVTDKRERHVVIEEIRMRKDQNWTKVYNACNFNMYKKHPYKRDVIGTPEIISQVTRDEIMNYYKTFYSPENMTTIIVGDFNKEKILAKVEKEFDFKGRENAVEQPVYEIDQRKKTQVFEQNANVNTGFMMYGFLGPQACEAKEIIALDMISIILGEGVSSRLNQNLIEKASESVFNMVSSCNYQFKDGSNFFVQANFKPEKKDIALKLIDEEINKLNEKINEREFNKAKKKILSSFACEAETVSSISETIGDYMTKLNDIKPIEDYLKIVDKMTIDDLLQISREYINLDFVTVSILLPNKNEKDN